MTMLIFVSDDAMKNMFDEALTKDEWVDAGKFHGSSTGDLANPGDTFFWSLWTGCWRPGTGKFPTIKYYAADSAIRTGDVVEVNHARKLLRAKVITDQAVDEGSWVEDGVASVDIASGTVVYYAMTPNKSWMPRRLGNLHPDLYYTAVSNIGSGCAVEVDRGKKQIRAKQVKTEEQGEWVDGGVYDDMCDEPASVGDCIFHSFGDGRTWMVCDESERDADDLTAITPLQNGDAVEVNRVTKQIRKKQETNPVASESTPVSGGNFDPVNRPAHYCQNPSGFQPVQFMEYMDQPMRSHAFKYLARRALKGSESLDMDKGIWFVKRHLAGPEKEFDELDIDAFVEDEPTPVGRMLRALFIGDDDEIEDALPALEAYAERRKAAQK